MNDSERLNLAYDILDHYNVRNNIIMNCNLDRDILGLSSLSSSFKLKDSNQTLIQVSSFLNQDSKFKVPEFFLYFSPKDTKILFPEINLSEDRFLKHIDQDI